MGITAYPRVTMKIQVNIFKALETYSTLRKPVLLQLDLPKAQYSLLTPLL